MLLAAKDEPPPLNQLPAAYILPLEENAKESSFSDGGQHFSLRFSILQCYAAQNQLVRIDNSLGNFEDLLIKRAILIPLIKGISDSHYSNPDFTKGRLVHVGKGVFWWEDQFITHSAVI